MSRECSKCAIFPKYLVCLKRIFVNVKDTYHILSTYKKNYLYIYEDNFGAKVLRDDCTLIVGFLAKKAGIAMYKNP